MSSYTREDYEAVISLANVYGRCKWKYIADRLGINKYTVRSWLYYGHKPRSMSKKHIDLTSDIVDYIDGLLLGDGSIIVSKGVNPKYQQKFSVKHVDWCKIVSNDFSTFGIGNSWNIYGAGSSARALLYTKTYAEWEWFRCRWYTSDGLKIVPRDINLKNPVVLLNWYLGDGSLGRVRGNREYQNTKLSTLGFRPSDVEFLVNLLGDVIGVRPKYMRYNSGFGFVIVMYKSDSDVFFEYLLDYIERSGS